MKIHHEIPIGKFWSKIGKIRISLWRFKIISFLKFHFATSLYHHYEYRVKIWAKMYKYSWFIAHSILKGFDQNILISDRRAIPNWPCFLSETTYNYEILPKGVIYVYVKSKKFRECRCMCLYSVKQNIEGDANLHHPPDRVNTVFQRSWVLGYTLNILVKACWCVHYI